MRTEPDRVADPEPRARVERLLPARKACSSGQIEDRRGKESEREGRGSPVREDQKRLEQTDFRVAVAAHGPRDELLRAREELRVQVGAEELGRRGEDGGEQDGRRGPDCGVEEVRERGVDDKEKGERGRTVVGGVQVCVEQDDEAVELRVEELEELLGFESRKDVCVDRVVTRQSRGPSPSSRRERDVQWRGEEG